MLQDQFDKLLVRIPELESIMITDKEGGIVIATGPIHAQLTSTFLISIEQLSRLSHNPQRISYQWNEGLVVQYNYDPLYLTLLASKDADLNQLSKLGEHLGGLCDKLVSIL